MSVAKDFFKNPLATCENFTTDYHLEEDYNILKDQYLKIKHINELHDDISGNIGEYLNKYDVLDISGGSNADNIPAFKYKDFNYKKPNGKIWLDHIDRKSTVKDAAKEDIHTMIVEQNNAYIVGMITIATVLVTTYLTFKWENFIPFYSIANHGRTHQ